MVTVSHHVPNHARCPPLPRRPAWPGLRCMANPDFPGLPAPPIGTHPKRWDWQLIFHDFHSQEWFRNEVMNISYPRSSVVTDPKRPPRTMTCHDQNHHFHPFPAKGVKIQLLLRNVHLQACKETKEAFPRKPSPQHIATSQHQSTSSSIHIR